MEASIVIPLRAQLQVVNSAVVNYLLVDAKLNDHFKVCRGESANDINNHESLTRVTLSLTVG